MLLDILLKHWSAQSKQAKFRSQSWIKASLAVGHFLKKEKAKPSQVRKRKQKPDSLRNSSAPSLED